MCATTSGSASAFSFRWGPTIDNIYKRSNTYDVFANVQLWDKRSFPRAPPTATGDAIYFLLFPPPISLSSRLSTLSRENFCLQRSPWGIFNNYTIIDISWVDYP
jgi:hypothetical protein